MPKYKNISTETISLYRDDKSLSPGNTIETIYFYPDLEEKNKLELLDVRPYLSPISKSDIIELNSNDTSKVTINLYDNGVSKYPSSVFKVSIIVLNITGADYIFLRLNNDEEENIEINYNTYQLNATNTLKLLAGAKFSFKNSNLVKYITFELPDGAKYAKIYYEILNPLSEFFF